MIKEQEEKGYEKEEIGIDLSGAYGFDRMWYSSRPVRRDRLIR